MSELPPTLYHWGNREAGGSMHVSNISCCFCLPPAPSCKEVTVTRRLTWVVTLCCACITPPGYVHRVTPWLSCLEMDSENFLRMLLFYFLTACAVPDVRWQRALLLHAVSAVLHRGTSRWGCVLRLGCTGGGTGSVVWFLYWSLPLSLYFHSGAGPAWSSRYFPPYLLGQLSYLSGEIRHQSSAPGHCLLQHGRPGLRWARQKEVNANAGKS